MSGLKAGPTLMRNDSAWPKARRFRETKGVGWVIWRDFTGQVPG